MVSRDQGWYNWQWSAPAGSVPGAWVDVGPGFGPGGWVDNGRGEWVDNGLGQQEPQSRESRMDLPGMALPGNQTAVSGAGASDAAAPELMVSSILPISRTGPTRTSKTM